MSHSNWFVALRIDPDLSGVDASSLPCDNDIHMVWLLAEVQGVVNQLVEESEEGPEDSWAFVRALLLQIANPSLSGPLSPTLAMHFKNHGGCFARLLLALADGKKVKLQNVDNDKEEEGVLIMLPHRVTHWPPVEPTPATPSAQIGDLVRAKVEVEQWIHGIVVETKSDGKVIVNTGGYSTPICEDPTVIPESELTDADRLLLVHYREGTL